MAVLNSSIMKFLLPSVWQKFIKDRRYGSNPISLNLNMERRDNMYNHETVTEATINGKKGEVRIVQNKYNCFISLRERIKNESLSFKKRIL